MKRFNSTVQAVLLPAITIIMVLIYGYRSNVDIENSRIDDESAYDPKLSTQRKLGFKDPNGHPNEYIKYFSDITTKPGQASSGYSMNYRMDELRLSLAKKRSAKARTTSVNVTEVLSRGPGNVGGRTRALIVDPDNPSFNTWYAGASSGGIWKTTDAGQSWTNLTEDLPNLSTNSLAMAESNSNIIYAGTGELYANNLAFVRGDGIFKSVDRGVTWNQLVSTANDPNFNSVNRLIVSPVDEDIVVAVTNTGIYKTIDGGISWSNKFESNGNSVQDLDADPNDFNIQYACVNSNGIYKSIDAGETWERFSSGISEGERFELAIAPTNTNKIYTSTYDIEDNTIVYVSENKGTDWAIFNVIGGDNPNFLGEQGWYDNIIAVDPFDEDVVFVGGVYLGKFEFQGSTELSDPTFLGVDQVNTASFLSFVNFSQDFFEGRLEIGTGNNPSAEFMTVELRFGPGKSQLAHRFSVPSNGGAGIPASEYNYEDYVLVPFEVWDVSNNRQLMVSFRDQQNDGSFNLNPQDDENDPDLLTAREYIYISNIDYQVIPDPDITSNAEGQEFNNLYFFWPVLTDDALWNPSNLPESIMRIKFGSQVQKDAVASIISDPRGTYNGENGNLHADHHGLITIPKVGGGYRILNGNDGGLGISENEGVSWTQIDDGYITTQFYGADKKPGADEYLGGTQDNGTWQSPREQVADVNSIYNSRIGGDGFEVIWHAQDPSKLIGGAQFNQFFRSLDGGASWTNAQNGIAIGNGDSPFISRLATSRTSPDVLYAVGAGGVYKSEDFGGLWSLKPISVAQRWTFQSGNVPVATSQHDVEVSLANDKIVWAGSGMDDFRNIFVSTDAGENFDAVRRATEFDLGAISGIATHPFLDSTAYLLFSFSGAPKIIRTEDLGSSWEDISGFDNNTGLSTRNFPNVIVHSLLVLPNDPDVIWAGTEIGLYISEDNGLSWSLSDIGLPRVAIWSMKVVDDEVVIGTHGRGIWTATIENIQESQAYIRRSEYLGNRDLNIEIDLPVSFDNVRVFQEGDLVGEINEVTPGILEQLVTVEPSAEDPEFFIETIIEGRTYRSSKTTLELDFASEIISFTQKNTAESPSELVLEANISEEYDSLELVLNDVTIGVFRELQVGNAEFSITINEPGAYEASIRGYYGDLGFESEKVTLDVLTVTSLNALERPLLLKLYPNPAENYINYELDHSLSDMYTVSVYDSKGHMVSREQRNRLLSSTQLSIESLGIGTYIFSIESDNKVFVQRFIKE